MEKYLVDQYQQVILEALMHNISLKEQIRLWLMTADIDGIPFVEAYSYSDNLEYQNDPIGIRTNTTGSHRGYNIFCWKSKNGT